MYSDRNRLVSVAAAMGTPKKRRGYLGRWSAGPSDDYSRGAKQVARGIQKEVATELRRNIGVIGESGIFGGFKNHIVKMMGLLEGDADKILESLASPAPLQAAREMIVNLSAQAGEEAAHPPRPDRPPGAATKTEVDPSSGHNVVPVSRKRGVRRIHRAGGCDPAADTHREDFSVGRTPEAVGHYDDYGGGVG